MANPPGIPTGWIRQLKEFKEQLAEQKRVIADLEQRLSAIEKARRGGRPPKQPQEATAQEEMPF